MDKPAPDPLDKDPLDKVRAHLRAGRVDEAHAACRRELEAQPDNAQALHLLGVVAFRRKHFQDAAGLFRRALELEPENAAHSAALGRTLTALKQPGEALAAYRRALEIEPDNTNYHNYVGLVFSNLDEPLKAAGAHRRAIELRPGFIEAHNNLGVALAAADHNQEAITAYRRAIQIRPEAQEPHANLGRALLVMGQLEEGWREYEWRWQNPVSAYPGAEPKYPPWDGSALAGRSILIHAEQGLGDTIQFIRYAPMVSGGKVSVVCQPALRRLFKHVPGVASWHNQGDPLPPADVHISLLSLPRIFNTRLETIPAPIPYLTAEPELVMEWARRLRELSDGSPLRVGLVWRGNPDNPRDRHRSVGLEPLLPLLELPGIQFFALQVGPGQEEIAALQANLANLTDLSGQLTDFAHTAAVLQHLDLLISADTAAAHLAGALGRPCWMMAFFAHDFRWLKGREDSPWYPSLRLFHQPGTGQWPPVAEGLKAALSSLPRPG